MITSFKQALINTYIENPCSTQPTALWKTFYLFKELNNKFEVQDEKVTKLLSWNDDMLHTYWNCDSTNIYMKNICIILI